MTIEFYEKPGCINNTKQKAKLKEHGFEVTADSLLEEKWTVESLRPFFGNMPLARWFNMSAPRIKSGEVKPECFDEASAIAAMIKDPYLIRRPLLTLDGHRICGFDHPKVDKLLKGEDISTMLNCPQANNKC